VSQEPAGDDGVWGEAGPSQLFRVPATSANLGVAFDCAAVAVQLHLEVMATPRPQPGIDLTYRGPQPQAVGSGSDNLLIRALAAGTRRFGGGEPSLWLHVRSSIPIGVGMGSSAAAIVAGLAIAAGLAPTRPSDEVFLELAAELDGHPDNVAAAYLGGLVVVAGVPGGLLTARVAVPDELRFTFAIPDRTMPTEEARGVLPSTYARADAVSNLQRTALLVATAFSGSFDFRPEFFDDRWHQPQRARLLPGLRECLELRHPKLLGVCLSGSGSAVLAISRGEPELAGALLKGAFARAGVEAQTISLAADNMGTPHRSGDG
jgi:homoserine kinase